MQIICSYCRKEIGKKIPLDDNRVSHGMCKECHDYYFEQIKGMSFDKYLERFETPVLIVNDQGRIVAANKKAESVLGKANSEITGLLGGEAMECEYARLPGGCGNTVHCPTCSIRNTIMKTMESGESQTHIPVKLQREDQEINMFISVEKVDSLVRVKIEV